jgi:hypothetical protein
VRHAPGAGDAEHKKRNAVSDNRHLEKAREDRKVDDRFGSLTVISSPKSGNEKRKKRGDEWRCLAPNDLLSRWLRLSEAQCINARDNAVLTERESANAMIARLAQRPRAVAALRHRWTLRVVITSHQFVMSSRLSYVESRLNVQRFFESS